MHDCHDSCLLHDLHNHEAICLSGMCCSMPAEGTSDLRTLAAGHGAKQRIL